MKRTHALRTSSPAVGSTDGASVSHPRSPLRRPGRTWRRRALDSQAGQAAIVLVVALTVAMTTVGGVMVTTIVNNDPILTQTSIQRYAYRALASGVNAYQNMINANPYLAACNSTTNPGAANATAQCAGINYQAWSQVPGTEVGNGVIPEYYKFDNPREVIDPTTNAITYLDVQIVGAAGFPGKDVYYSTVAKFTPANGFLDNVWWSNYEATGTPSSCQYYWATNYSNAGSCTPVYFAVDDSITGPVFSNDSIYIDGKPNFGANYPVTTADPYCQFVNPLNGTHGLSPSNKTNPADNCYLTNHGTNQDIGTYDAATSSYGKGNYEPIPTDNSALANYAEQGGCYYVGPTTITLNGNQMTVSSPGTTSTGTGDSPFKFGSNASTCPTNGTGPLPVNGVVFVNGGNNNTVSTANANPFDGYQKSYSCGTRKNPKTCYTTVDAQTSTGGCSGCYYGQTTTPDFEGDAFVSGSLSGQLTIGANNNVIIDGPLTYADCAWSSQSNCYYNDSTSSSATNDVLGLIAYQYVEVNHPVDSYGNILPACSSTSLARPLCDPSTSGGNPAGGQGLEIDASLLGLQNSFIVNNYGSGSSEGTLTMYGSIQQDARGAVGKFLGSSITSGYSKKYLWDSRLPLYSPPYYLTPGTPSWSLVSSSESYTGTCPPMPPAQPTPNSTQPAYPISGSTTCTPAS